MSPLQPCYRHPRDKWIASCPECTTWHMAAIRAAGATHEPADAHDEQPTTPADVAGRDEARLPDAA